MRATAPSLALLLLTVALTGCLSGPSADGEDLTATDRPATDGSVEGAPAEEERPTSAPDWAVGHWWSWTHDDGEQVREWTLAVAEDLGQAWRVAPDAQEPARFNAIFDWYVFGEMSKDQLSDEDAGGLVFYDFPLTDGKTWTSTFGPGSVDWEVTHTATYDPAIETARGPLPGHTIEARVNGTVFFAYDHVPEIGWFSQLTNHVLPEEGGQGEVDWTYETTDWGTGYAGTVHTAQAEMLLDTFHEVDLSPDRLDARPNPQASFEVAEEASTLFVIAGVYAEAGVSQATLLDPEQGTHQLTATATGLDGAITGMGHFMEPVPGRWEVMMGGAGLDTEGWVVTWQLFDAPVALG